MGSQFDALISQAVDVALERQARTLQSGEWVPAPEYLSPRQASVYTGFAVSTLEGWRHDATGPKYSQVGRQVRYRLRDIDAWMASHAVEVVK